MTLNTDTDTDTVGLFIFLQSIGRVENKTIQSVTNTEILVRSFSSYGIIIFRENLLYLILRNALTLVKSEILPRVFCGYILSTSIRLTISSLWDVTADTQRPDLSYPWCQHLSCPSDYQFILTVFCTTPGDCGKQIGIVHTGYSLQHYMPWEYVCFLLLLMLRFFVLFFHLFD